MAQEAVENAHAWTQDYAEVVSFASFLKEICAFKDPEGDEASALLYFFEKPYKWTGEYERWCEMGKPAAEDCSPHVVSELLDGKRGE